MHKYEHIHSVVPYICGDFNIEYSVFSQYKHSPSTCVKEFSLWMKQTTTRPMQTPVMATKRNNRSISRMLEPPEPWWFFSKSTFLTAMKVHWGVPHPAIQQFATNKKEFQAISKFWLYWWPLSSFKWNIWAYQSERAGRWTINHVKLRSSDDVSIWGQQGIFQGRLTEKNVSDHLRAKCFTLVWAATTVFLS